MTRTPKETLMLKALERISKYTGHIDSSAALRNPDVSCASNCAPCYSSETLASVREMDEKELGK